MAALGYLRCRNEECNWYNMLLGISLWVNLSHTIKLHAGVVISILNLMSENLRLIPPGTRDSTVV